MTIKFLVMATALLQSSGGLWAEVISIDFNTFALQGERGEMQGQDPTFGVGAVWNHLWLPNQNSGELEADPLIDAEGKPTAVRLFIKGSKIASWWSTEKLMPESKLYRDYMAFSDDAVIEIGGLKPLASYDLAVFGFPLTWGNVQLKLNGQSLHVKSGPKWGGDQQPAGVLRVQSDADGKLAGTVKGMWSGLHISTEPLALRSPDVVMIEGEPEKEMPAEFPPTKSVVYKTVAGHDLHLDIYNPEGHRQTDRRGAIVFFHGGSWSGGWKTYLAPQCHYLAQRGMVGITVEYRVTGRPPKSTPADCVRDAKSAMRWVRKHAGELGIDPNRIAAGGGSAGGHLAAATAYLDDYNEEGEDTSVSCRPQALVLINPVIDNSPGGGYPYGPQPMSENWPRWSPMHNVTPAKAVPTIFFLGDKDHLIPVATGSEFKRITEQAGAECEYVVYPGAKHGFFSWGGHQANALERMAAFFDKLGYAEAGGAAVRSPDATK